MTTSYPHSTYDTLPTQSPREPIHDFTNVASDDAVIDHADSPNHDVVVEFSIPANLAPLPQPDCSDVPV